MFTIELEKPQRYHYSVKKQAVIVVDSIFADAIEAHKNTHFSNPELFWIACEKRYSEYFYNFILDDLYYLGYVTKADYEILIKRDPTVLIYNMKFIRALWKFVLDHSTNLGLENAKKHNNYIIFSLDLEAKISSLVVEKYCYQMKIKEENISTDNNGETKIIFTVEKPKSEESTDKEITDVEKFNNLLDEATKNLTEEEKERIKENIIPYEQLGPDKDYISWDSYFMGIATLASLRSKDPRCKVGACMVKKNKIVSTGYNGLPKGLDNNKYPWAKNNEDPTKNKYFYVVHAEINALLNCEVPTEKSTLYVTKFPCNECAKAIIQAGVKKIIYDDRDSDEIIFADHLNIATMNMFKDAGIEIDRYQPINFSVMINL